MRRSIVLLYFLLCLSGLLNAQTRIFDKNIEARGDSVYVSFKTGAEKDVPLRYKEIIIPYINNGRDSLFFDLIEIYGKGKYMHQRQEKYLEGDRDWELGKGQTIAGDTLVYTSAVPLKRWMASACFGVKRYLSGCNCEKDHSDEILDSLSLFKEPVPPGRRIPAYVLEDASREWDFGHDELEIVFKVSRSEIDHSVFNNEVTFAKILQAVDKVYSNPQYRLYKIEVAGYASPEGPPDFNAQLGENRAKALIDYIIKHRPQYNLTPDHFNIRNGEENWEGLRRVVAASDMKWKDEVLEIIDNDTIPDERRKIWIERLDHGWVWHRMLKQIYPHLRCARYLAMFYDSTDDKVVDVINEANEMIRKGLYVEAYSHLQPVGDDMRAYNSIGVALMLQGKFEEAMPWFEKALGGNCPNAQKNIDAIKSEWEYEAEQRRIIDEYMKKYE